MSTWLKLKIPARLARGRQRFDTFRKTHQGYRRLPESLWPAPICRVFSASEKKMNLFRGGSALEGVAVVPGHPVGGG